MRRGVLSLIALLFAGAIINVAVAWGFPKLKWFIADITSSTPPKPQPSVINFGAEVGSSAYAFRELALRGTALGWPCASYNNHTGRINVVGSAVNTAFYAAVVWILFAGPGRFRRWRRLHRGLCLACAYPIGTNAVCTECGAELRHRTIRQQHPIPQSRPR